MPKPATGELRRHASGFEARIRVDDDGTREGFDLTTRKTEVEATERCKALASIAVRVRRARHAAELPKLLDMAARARAGRAWESALAAVDVLCAGTVAADRPDVPTFVAFATDWTDGKATSGRRRSRARCCSNAATSGAHFARTTFAARPAT